MEKINTIINHPLSKAVALGVIGTMFLIEKRLMYSGMAYGYGLRELLLAFKSK